MGHLDGQAAVVTGTAQGIGRGIADLLESEGAMVHRVDKDAVDLRDSAAVDAFFAALGEVHILVNNAGGVQGQTHTPIDELTDADWDAVVDANLRTAFNCTRAAARLMKAARYGRIVNISSGAGRSVSLTGIQAYTSAKAGQIGFTRQMAHELGGTASRSTASRPGSCSRTRPPRPSGTATAPRASGRWPRRSPPAGPARRTTSPAACCSSRRRTPAGSAGRRSRSTAATRSSRDRT